ncbi:hypothetical protein LCGC14_2873760, partial [marine sediment metagenome]
MEYLPLFVDLKDRACLVVGGGEIAARKAGLLRKANANVTIVAPEISVSTKSMIDAGEAVWLNSLFIGEQLSDQLLVIAATNDEAVNRDVYDQAKAKNILVNVVDSPELC